MLKNKKKFYFPFWLLLLLPAVGYADFNLKPATQDYSYLFLEAFYGKVDGVLNGQNAVLAKMFGVFNAVGIIIAALVIIYIVVISTLNTANEGEMLGRKWSSMWIPIKLVVGFVLLIPKASGYSIVQIIVMWIVVMGVGAADRVWETVVNHFIAGGSLIHTPTHNLPVEAVKANVKLAADILQAEVCAAGLENVVKDNQNLVSKYQDTRQYLPSFVDSINTQRVQLDANNNYVIEIPGEIKNFEYLKGKCGKITWQATNKTDFCANYQGERLKACRNYVQQNPQVIKELQANASFKQAVPVALQALINTLKGTANFIAANRKELLKESSSINITSTSIGSLSIGQPIVVGNYVFNQILEPIVSQYNVYFQTNAKEPIQAEALKYAASAGWIFAGSFANNLLVSYQPSLAANLVQNYMPSYSAWEYKPINQLGEAAAEAYRLAYSGPLHDYITRSFIEDISGEGIATRLLVTGMAEEIVKPIGGFLNKLNINFDLPWPIGNIRFDLINGNVKSSFENTLLNLAKTIGGKIDELLKVVGSALTLSMIDVHVLSALRVIGVALIGLGLSVYGIFGVVSAIIVFLVGFAPTMNLNLAIHTLTAVLTPLLLVIAGFLVLSGSILAFYIPFLPVIVFTFGVLGWLVGVFESLIAAPLVALGIMIPEAQESFMGKASPAIMLLLNLFLRPMLMLFGLIGGLILANIGVWLFLALFSITALAMAGTNLSVITAIFTGAPIDFKLVLDTISVTVSNLVLLIAGLLVIPILITSTILAIVKKSFGLVHSVPDKILRWLSGGYQEQLGSDMSSGAQEAGELTQREFGAGKEAFTRGLERYDTSKKETGNRQSFDEAKERGNALQGSGPSSERKSNSE